MPSREFSVSIEGSEALAAAFRRLSLAGPSTLSAGLYQEAEVMMTLAKSRTPVDTGNLRASGHVVPPSISAQQVTVTLGFGGPAGVGNQGDSNSQTVGYAVYVHEDMRKHHPVGQAKFLESAVLERLSGIAERLAAYLRRRYEEMTRAPG